MKIKLSKSVIFIIILCIATALLCSCVDTDAIMVDLGLYESEYSPGDTFPIMLRECDGISFPEGNVIDAKYGENVTVTFRINNNYEYFGNSAGAVRRINAMGLSVIELKNVKGPMTVDFNLCAKWNMYFVELNSDLSGARVDFVKGSEKMRDKEEVTVKAQVPAGFRFAGWTEGGYIDKGWQIVSTDREYTFTPQKNTTKLYANFSPIDKYTINYHVNGGTIVGSDKTVYTVEVPISELYTMPTTIRANDPDVRFRRHGYTAVGYSTEPIEDYADTAGANKIIGFCNIGGVCEVPRSAVLDLYVVWAKDSPASDFTVADVTYDGIFTQGSRTAGTASGVVIRKYKGSDKTVVIPETIGGKQVIGIAEDAFYSNQSIKKVVIPKTVVKIERYAFYTCYNLDEVVFFDSLQYVDNESFPKALSTVVLSGQRGSVYSSSTEGAFCIKYGRMRTLNNKGKDTLIVLSGSSTLYGLNSEKMYEYLGGKYEIINYGTNAATQMLFYLEVMANYVDSGDLIVYAPEYDIAAPMGDNAIHWKLFRGNDQCYDIFREVDMANYTNFWGAWQEHQTASVDGNLYYAAMTMSVKPYHALQTGINEYGDILTPRTYPTYKNTEKNKKITTNLINSQRAVALNAVNKKIKATGAVLAMSFCTKDRIGYQYDWTADADAATKTYAELLDIPIISNIGTFVFENELMYDSQWHTNFKGANKRTYELSFDIKQFLLGDGKDSYMSYSKRVIHEKNDFPNSFDQEEN